jgi:hypothetical protein
LRLFYHCLALLALAGCAEGARAQSFTVTLAPSASLGTIVSAASGVTTFRVDDNTGAVSTVSGSAARLTFGSAQPIMASVTCTGTSTQCNRQVTITIASAGTPTNRAGSLTNFTATAGTATFASSPTGTNPVTLKLNPIARNSTVTFYVGYDFPVKADNSGAGTGLSTSLFSVTPSASQGTGTPGTGTSTATVIRSITLSNAATLSFGRVVLPGSGSQTVTYDPAVGGVRLSGSGSGGAVLSSPAPSLAGFAVAGEGGQAFTLTVPGSFTLSGPSGSTPITITTLPSASGAQTLTGSAGAAGSFNFTVGGRFAVSATTMGGSYSGSFAATVQYN